MLNIYQSVPTAPAATATAAKDVLSVRDFGATGAPDEDATAAVHAALQAANGRRLYFPEGTYDLRGWTLDHAVTFDRPTEILGANQNNTRLIASNRYPLLEPAAELTVRDLAFENFGNVIMCRSNATYDITQIHLESITLLATSSLFEATTAISEDPDRPGVVRFGAGRVGNVTVRNVRARGASPHHESWMRLVKVYCPFEYVRLQNIEVKDAVNDVFYIGEELNGKVSSGVTAAFPPEFGRAEIVGCNVARVVKPSGGDIHAVSLRYVAHAVIRDSYVEHVRNTGDGNCEAIYIKAVNFLVDGVEVVDGTNASSDSEGAFCLKKGVGTISNTIVRETSPTGIGLFAATPSLRIANSRFEGMPTALLLHTTPAASPHPRQIVLVNSTISAARAVLHRMPDTTLAIIDSSLIRADDSLSALIQIAPLVDDASPIRIGDILLERTGVFTGATTGCRLLAAYGSVPCPPAIRLCHVRLAGAFDAVLQLSGAGEALPSLELTGLDGEAAQVGDFLRGEVTTVSGMWSAGSADLADAASFINQMTAVSDDLCAFVADTKELRRRDPDGSQWVDLFGVKPALAIG